MRSRHYELPDPRFPTTQKQADDYAAFCKRQHDRIKRAVGLGQRVIKCQG